jgi:hypothetical protein
MTKKQDGREGIYMPVADTGWEVRDKNPGGYFDRTFFSPYWPHGAGAILEDGEVILWIGVGRTGWSKLTHNPLSMTSKVMESSLVEALLALPDECFDLALKAHEHTSRSIIKMIDVQEERRVRLDRELMETAATLLR